MSGKWYSSRSIQASLIGGSFVLLSAIVGGYFATRNRSPLPPLEIKTVIGGGEKVLATLALKPERQLVDSTRFAALGREYLLLSDTFGIAIEKPEEYRWTAGPLKKAGSVTIEDMPIIRAINKPLEKLWGIDSTFALPSYGVRLDYPFEIQLAAKSRIDEIPVGGNPFLNSDFMQMTEKAFSQYFNFDRSAYRRETIRQADSIIQSSLPVTEKVYSGVFVYPISEKDLPKTLPIPFMYLSLFDKVVYALTPGIPSPNLFFVDRHNKTAVFNESVTLTDVEVSGVHHDKLIINRVGYAVQTGKLVYVVFLQFLSNQDDATLAELQGFFRSVQLRSER